ncbi:hypothetical protein KFK09_009241 [Dendrobium nobile]|uniref:Uncharacterized protein n=1 Tax=Dendrobium nobile TaxID=94219 RepID=A0A8T3BMB4_DENNO|nr:hypothetical protein KFK09_009241 [Dendrobium nobile]
MFWGFSKILSKGHVKVRNISSFSHEWGMKLGAKFIAEIGQSLKIWRNNPSQN